jgi:hypothetical protein
MTDPTAPTPEPVCDGAGQIGGRFKIEATEHMGVISAAGVTCPICCRDFEAIDVVGTVPPHATLTSERDALQANVQEIGGHVDELLIEVGGLMAERDQLAQRAPAHAGPQLQGPVMFGSTEDEER